MAGVMLIGMTYIKMRVIEVGLRSFDIVSYCCGRLSHMHIILEKKREWK
jgi:hypothetical protein